ncbi:MSF1-domain-containing protein [Auricularia subglabra TFB-10046 SS5]|nr:MSF1-domain-containing protein [Auricularia subglabra TFB-10046 SS5]
MHFFSQLFHFEHPWLHVSHGIWYKYPNPYCAHVASVDVLDRSVDPSTGVVRTERIIGVRQNAPVWIIKILGGTPDTYVREVSFVDPATRHTSLTTVNLSMSQYLTVLERIHYIPSAEDPDKTEFHQTAEIQAARGTWRALAARLEKWSVERIGQNASAGRLGFEHVLRTFRAPSDSEAEATA